MAPLPASDSFDQETILVLAGAYERALAALALAEEGHGYVPGAAAARHRLARQIVQMGQQGERDPDRLRLGVLTELRRG